VRKVTIYYEEITQEDSDTRNWCVDFPHSDTVKRFRTFFEASMYASQYTSWLMGITQNKETQK
jgi:hypothetical protein